MPAAKLIVGVDFDNTIVRYDEVFHRVALERGLIPEHISKTKESVRDFLRQTGKEDAWTEMQGFVYGTRMSEAAAFPGALECLAALKKKNIQVFIISHKTRTPYKGESHDLHAAAWEWLRAHGFSREDVFFKETKEEKLKQIGVCACTHFVDDLPELLSDKLFPGGAEKILFAPACNAVPEKGVTVCNSWNAIESFFENIESENDLKIKISALLPQGKWNIAKLPYGGNNRIYLAEQEGRRFIAKHYFTHKDDQRNRLSTEYAFLDFTEKNGVKALPRPIARSDRDDLAVYSYAEGKRLLPEEINSAAVKAAFDFLIDLNNCRSRAGQDFPLASEACFSVREHLDMLKSRIKRLESVDDADAKRFINNELIPAFQRIEMEILAEAKTKQIDLDEKLAVGDRIISPSDFGFHNALKKNTGEFVFLDFEYAGWDDPAKTAGDFFSQEALPVPVECLDGVVKTLSEMTDHPVKTAQRIRLLLRLYRIKWCCIVLNHFLPVGSRRREFAGIDLESARKEQLKKAGQLLGSLDKLK